jgi:hypothetical protein
MIWRPILRPMPFLRAVARITASLTGNTVPARSRAHLYAGHPSMISSRCSYLAHPPLSMTNTFNGIGILHDHPKEIGHRSPQGIITFWVARSRKAAQACSNRMVSCSRISSNSRLISA